MEQIIITMNDTTLINHNKEIVEHIQKTLNEYCDIMNKFKNSFEHHMKIIVNEILRELNPIAIYLVGSFGRNEGSLYKQDHHIKPLRDYDILIVVDRRVRRKILDRVSLRIHEKLNLVPPARRDVEFKGFMVSLTQFTLSDLQRQNLLKLYELKHASKLLHGIDVRKYIRVDISNISKYNGILILLGKVIGLLGLLNIRMLINKSNNEIDESIDFVYECLKVYTEIPTVLSLLNHSIYKPKFLDRCVAFYSNYDKLFPELRNVLPDLKYDVLHACVRRLLLSKEYLERENIRTLFQRTIRTLSLVTAYYIAKAYGRIVRYNECGSINVNLGKLYMDILYDLFEFYIENSIRQYRHRSFQRILTYITIYLFLRERSFKLFIKLRKAGFRAKLRVLFTNDALLRLWFAGLTLLKSFKNGNLDQETMLCAIKMISSIVDLKDILKYTISDLSMKIKLTIFEYLRRTLLSMLMIADKTIHMKE